MLSGNVRYKRKHVPLDIRIRNTLVEQQNVLRYFGVKIDRYLSSDAHATVVTSKVNNRTSAENAFVH